MANGQDSDSAGSPNGKGLVSFFDLGLDVFGGTILGATGAALELTAATLAQGVAPTVFTSSIVIFFAGVTGLTILAGCIFSRLGSRLYHSFD